MERQADTYCEQGKKLLEEGKYLQALEYFQAAVELDAENMEGLFGQVCVFKALGKFDKAQDLQKLMDAIAQKKPSVKHKELSSIGQLESARQRYSTLLKELMTVETDEFRLRHGSYSPEAYKELAACENLIESIEQQLNLKRTDFKQQREAMIAKQSTSARKMKRLIRRRMSKYKRIAIWKVMKTGKDSLGVNVYGYSQATLTRLASIKNEVRKIDGYLPQNYIDANAFSDIRNRCLGNKTKRAKRRLYRKAKRAYSHLLRHNLVRSRTQYSEFEVSWSVKEREKTLRSRIVALEPVEGNSWCNMETARLIKWRKDRPNRMHMTLKIFGIVLAVSIGLLAIYVVLQYFWYVLIGVVGLMAVIGFFSSD